MPNGKVGDSPLSDFTVHGIRRFPPDIMELLERINDLGHRQGRWPLGENWPYGTRDDLWCRGEDLEGARRDLTRLLDFMEAGRGEEILHNPRTGRPFKAG